MRISLHHISGYTRRQKGGNVSEYKIIEVKRSIFEDNDADLILSKLKNIEEKTYGYISDNGLKQLPIEVIFEKYANGFKDVYTYRELII